MTTIRIALLAAALLAATAACHGNATSSTPAGAALGDGAGDGLGDTVGRAMQDAREKMSNESVKISRDGHGTAEITTKGDLVIDGKTVAVNDEQRALLLEYRAETLGIAEAGMEVGTQGAKLATHAVAEALKGVFSGDPDRIEKRVEAQAQGIKAAARKLCDRLPAMYETQKRLAAALPEFAPYAKMERKDIDDCRHDIDEDVAVAPPAPPAPPAAPGAPAAPPSGDAAGDTATAKDLVGTPRLPQLPKLRDIKG